MKLRLLIISILLAGYLYPQNFDWDWFVKRTVSVPAPSLPSLVANTDTVWAGGYMPIGTTADTANLDSTREWITTSSRQTIRQNGAVTRVAFYVKDASAITTFKIRIWRRLAAPDISYTLITTSEDLSGVLTNGVNTINLTTPLNVLEGDFYGVQYEATDSGLAMQTSTLDSSKMINVLLAPEIANYSWHQNATLVTKFFPIRFYMRAPAIVFIGNSIVQGATYYNNGVFPENIPVGYLLNNVPTTTFEYRLCNYANFTYQNMGWNGQWSHQILARFKTDCIDLKPAFVVFEGGINDAVNGGFYSDTIISSLSAMADSCVLHGIPFAMLNVMTYNNQANIYHEIWDSVNAAMQPYVTSNGGLWVDTRQYNNGQRDSGTSIPNDWQIYPRYTEDEVHYTRAGNSRIAGAILKQLRTLYTIANDTQVIVINSPALPDTARRWMPITLNSQAYDLWVLDSVYGSWKKGVNGSLTHYKYTPTTGDSTYGTENTFQVSFAPDTSTMTDADTIYFYDTAKGLSGTATTTRTLKFKASTYTISTDSLKYYVEFEKNRGFGLSSYAQKIPSLYCYKQSAADTLQLGANSTAEADDPTDSTAFGFIWFDGSNDGAVFTKNVIFTARTTIIVKFRGYGNGIIIEPETFNTFLYTSTSSTFAWTGGDVDYYNNWGLQADDSVTAVQNDSICFYRNGILKKGKSDTPASFTSKPYVGCRTLSTLFFMGRIYSFAIYNKRLTQAEIQMWND